MVTGKKPYENMTQGEVIQSVSQVRAGASGGRIGAGRLSNNLVAIRFGACMHKPC